MTSRDDTSGPVLAYALGSISAVHEALSSPVIERDRDIEQAEVHLEDAFLRLQRALKRKEEEMALRKFGEGEVIPESEQQKSAAKQGGMSEEAWEALRKENEEADGPRT